MGEYISIVDNTGRTSTLELGNDTITVIGVLPHGSEFAPKTVDDAEALLDWLENWLENNFDEIEDDE